MPPKGWCEHGDYPLAIANGLEHINDLTARLDGLKGTGGDALAAANAFGKIDGCPAGGVPGNCRHRADTFAGHDGFGDSAIGAGTQAGGTFFTLSSVNGGAAAIAVDRIKLAGLDAGFHGTVLAQVGHANLSAVAAVAGAWKCS